MTFATTPRPGVVERDSSLSQRWPLARLLILSVAGGFFGLMFDVRIEHVQAVRERSIAWVPIVVAGGMTLACLLSAARWNRTSRRALVPLLVLALVVGAVGFYLHNAGDLTGVARTALAAWTDARMHHEDVPPQLAPMAFAGLSAIGLLACARA